MKCPACGSEGINGECPNPKCVILEITEVKTVTKTKRNAGCLVAVQLLLVTPLYLYVQYWMLRMLHAPKGIMWLYWLYLAGSAGMGVVQGLTKDDNDKTSPGINGSMRPSVGE